MEGFKKYFATKKGLEAFNTRDLINRAFKKYPDYILKGKPLPEEIVKGTVAAFSNKASECFEEEDYANSIKFYERALKLKPDDADVMCELGGVYQAQQKDEQAIEMFKKALSLRPGDKKIRDKFIELVKPSVFLDGKEQPLIRIGDRFLLKVKRAGKHVIKWMDAIEKNISISDKDLEIKGLAQEYGEEKIKSPAFHTKNLIITINQGAGGVELSIEFKKNF